MVQELIMQAKFRRDRLPNRHNHRLNLNHRLSLKVSECEKVRRGKRA